MKFIVVAMAILILATNSYATEVRPLSLTVLDAVTGKPIPNVPVFYKLLTAGLERYLLFFWKIDPVVYRPIVTETYITDNEGKIYILARSVSLNRHEQLFEEEIYLNIDNKSNEAEKHNADTFFSSKHEQLYNPVDDYIGVILCTASRMFGPDQIRGIKKSKGILLESMYIDNSLTKKSESIVIHLKRVAHNK